MAATVQHWLHFLTAHQTTSRQGHSFFFSQAFVFAFQGGDGKTFQICILYQKDVTVWFDCKENRAESNAQHCTVAFLHTAVRQSEVWACENGGQQQMCVQESSVNAHRQTWAYLPAETSIFRVMHSVCVVLLAESEFTAHPLHCIDIKC